MNDSILFCKFSMNVGLTTIALKILDFIKIH